MSGVETRERSPKVENVRLATYYGIYPGGDVHRLIPFSELKDGKTIEEVVSDFENRERGFADGVMVYDALSVTVSLPDGTSETILGQERNHRNYWIDPKNVVTVDTARETGMLDFVAPINYEGATHIVLPGHSPFPQSFNREQDQIIKGTELSSIK